MATLRKLISGLLPLVLIVSGAAAVGAQEVLPGQQLAQQSLRPYWHVFIAYALVIVLVIAWAGSIAKRLAEVEARLGK
jgi:hypothetical protein